MISFMLSQSSLIAVLVAAAVGFVVCMILHIFCPFKHWCQEQMQCDKNKQGCCNNKDQCHEHHDFIGHVFCKLGKFVVLFVQTYGISYFLQKLDVINNYMDAISVALFIAVAFVISHVFLAVAKHKRHLFWFLHKAVHILIVFSVIAAVLVYMASR